MRILQIGCVILFSLLSNSLYAQDRKHEITPADYASVSTVTQAAVSPDGKWVAYSEARWQVSSDDRKTDLWIVSSDGQGLPRRLTFDRANDRSIKWASDNKTLYFLGNRKREAEKKPSHDGTTQVWRISIDGGEPVAVTRVNGGISGYDLAAKAQALFYSVDREVEDEDAFAKLRLLHGKLEYGHGKRQVSQLRRLDLVTWRDEKWIDDKRYIREFTSTQDGKRIVMISAFDDSVIKSEGESRADVFENGTIVTPSTEPYRANAHSPHAWLEGLTWSADGKKFAFNAIFDGYPTELVIGTSSESGWSISIMERPSSLHVHGYGSPLRWHASGNLFFVGEMHGRNFVVPSDAGLLKTISPKNLPNRVVYGFDTDESGKTGAFIMGQTDRMGELYVADYHPGATFRKLFDANPQTSTWKLPTVKHITWKGKDGVEVGGILELPAGYESGTRLPLIVAMHGGPTSSTKAGLEFDPHNGRLYLAAKGYAVLLPNYRGSSGYGDKFLTDLLGKENDIEVNDIIAGVEHLVKEGIADSKQVGVTGWSNGGYLTNCLITRKNLPFTLKAASSGAGILDTIMEWGINDEPAYPKVLKKGLPWEIPDVYHKTSATYGLGNITTPTLIHVGGNDVRCPPAHSRMLYRAMRENLKVPVELVVYPNEPHGLSKYSNRLAKMEWDLAWFEKYLKP